MGRPRDPALRAAKRDGHLKYRSKVTCRNGHAAPERYTRNQACVACASESGKKYLSWQQERHHANPGRKYGLNREQYWDLVAEHKNLCAICGAEPGLSRRHAVDHNHSTKAVRGLLCGHCNRGLGLFRDDAALLRRAAEYLEKAWLRS